MFNLAAEPRNHVQRIVMRSILRFKLGKREGLPIDAGRWQKPRPGYDAPAADRFQKCLPTVPLLRRHEPKGQK